jgi:ACS family glucarate transporter-like MFS transporter
VRYAVLAALCLITLINYVQRNCFATAETTLRADRELGLTRDQHAAAVGVFFTVYALCQIPSGRLAQALQPRIALPLFAVGWSLALGVLALANGSEGFYWGRALMGMWQAGIFSCTTLAVAAWFPTSQRGFASGWLSACMFGGGAVCTVLSGALLGPLGWRGLFGVFVVPGLVWAAWFAFWFRNDPARHPGVNAQELTLIRTGAGDKAQASADGASASAWWLLLISPTLALICLQQFLRSGAIRFFDNTMMTYLQEERDYSLAQAGLLSSLPQVVEVLGGVAGGWFSDLVLARTGSRRAGRIGVAVGVLVTCAVCLAAAHQAGSLVVCIALFSVGAFLAAASAPIAYAVTMDVGGLRLGVVFATMNMVGNFGSSAFTRAVPWLKEQGGWGLVVGVVAGAHLVAALLWLPINPNRAVGEEFIKGGGDSTEQD